MIIVVQLLMFYLSLLLYIHRIINISTCAYALQQSIGVSTFYICCPKKEGGLGLKKLKSGTRLPL